MSPTIIITDCLVQYEQIPGVADGHLFCHQRSFPHTKHANMNSAHDSSLHSSHLHARKN